MPPEAFAGKLCMNGIVVRVQAVEVGIPSSKGGIFHVLLSTWLKKNRWFDLPRTLKRPWITTVADTDAVCTNQELRSGPRHYAVSGLQKTQLTQKYR